MDIGRIVKNDDEKKVRTFRHYIFRENLDRYDAREDLEYLLKIENKYNLSLVQLGKEYAVRFSSCNSNIIIKEKDLLEFHGGNKLEVGNQNHIMVSDLFDYCTLGKKHSALLRF